MPIFILDDERDLIKFRIINPEAKSLSDFNPDNGVLAYCYSDMKNYFAKHPMYLGTNDRLRVINMLAYPQIKERFKDLEGVNLEARLLQLERERILL